MNKPEWPIDSQLAHQYLHSVLASRRWWSREGEFVKKFEEKFGAFVGAPYAFSCTNGTAALEIGLKALGIGFGDFVVVPSLTFIGTAMAVLKVGAIPLFSDVEESTGCMDLESVQSLWSLYPDRIKCVILVHLGGQFGNAPRLVSWAQENGVRVVEDCAQAIGTTHKNKHVGIFGDIGCFSFQNSKNVSAGEGGCVVTKDARLASIIGKYIDYNRDVLGEDQEFTYIAGNHRLSEFQAAVLLAQLEDFPRLNAIRDERLRLLYSLLVGVLDVKIISSGLESTTLGIYLCMLRIVSNPGQESTRARFIDYLIKNNVPCWPGYDHLPLNEFAFFREALYLTNDPFWRKLSSVIPIEPLPPSRCPTAERLAKEFVWIPQFVFLRSAEEIHRIADVVQRFYRPQEVFPRAS